MEQIGLYIGLITEGKEPPIIVGNNNKSWKSKLGDLRKNGNVFCPDNVSAPFLYMFYSEGGVYLTYQMPLSSRPGDCIYATVYIPNTIQVDGDDLKKLLENIKDFVYKAKREISYKDHKSLDFVEDSANGDVSKERLESFLQGLKTKEIVPVEQKCSNGNNYAVVYLPVNSNRGWHYWFDSDIYQPAFADYKAVFFIAENEKVYLPFEKKIDDISNTVMKQKTVILNPLKDNSDITVYYNNGKKFDSPIRLFEDEKIELTVKKNKRDDEKLDITVKEDTSIDNEIKKIEWSRSINIKNFQFKDSKSNQPISSDKVKLKIGNETIDSTPCKIKENIAGKIIANIAIDKYCSYELKENNTIDFTNEDSVEIKLAKRKYTFHGTVIVDYKGHKEKAESVSITSTIKIDDKDSLILKKNTDKRQEPPIDDDPPEPHPVFPYKRMILYLAGGLIAGLIAGLFLHDPIQPGMTRMLEFLHIGTTDPKINNESTPETVATTAPAGGNSTIDHNYLIYLEDHTKWDDSTLNQYKATEGFFNELNNYEFDKIRERFEKFPWLASVPAMDSIKTISEKYSDLKIKDPYNKDSSDFVITPKMWCEAVSRYQERASAAPNSVKGGSEKKKEEGEKSATPSDETVQNTEPKPGE